MPELSMARRPRLHVPGGFYHVTLRGNHRQPIFFSPEDRDLLDGVVANACGKVNARVHAYCWMTNHIHLLVQVSDAPLSRLMLRVASQYARRVQARFDTTGHLFERRYHPVLVDADEYLLTLVRYIHLNPVRGGLVKDPADYPWSSHREYLGDKPKSWLTTSFTLGLFGTRRDRALARYCTYMAAGDACTWGTGRLATHPDHPEILGGDQFVRALMLDCARPRTHSSLEALLTECHQRFGVSPELLASPSRARDLARARAWLANQAVNGRVASICAVARRLGRSEGAIRQLMSRYPSSNEAK
jgi:putative transposase